MLPEDSKIVGISRICVDVKLAQNARSSETVKFCLLYGESVLELAFFYYGPIVRYCGIARGSVSIVGDQRGSIYEPSIICLLERNIL